ncbi:MAG TPA: FkbM family methyltransferase [Actinomycetota bacterium]|nr:FkbM family methyltransferase [Actinomycetota bacterium]
MGSNSSLLASAWPPVRTMGRKAVEAGLRRIPFSVLEPLRQAFPLSEPGSLQDRVQRRILAFLRHRGLPPDTEFFTLQDNPEISIEVCDSFIAVWLYWCGEKKGYEPEVLRWWKEFCKTSTNVLELGANIGYFTVQGAKTNSSAKYTAVEPHPGAARICRKNLDRNGISSVQVVEAAAVSTAQQPEIDLFLPGGRDHYDEAPCSGFAGGNEVHQEGTENISAYNSIRVAAVELRELIAGVDLLKIDVEGQEHQLLTSVDDQIRSSRPTMFLEVLPGTPRLRSWIAGLCSELDYRCFVPTSEALIPLSAEELSGVSLVDRFGTRDLVVTCRAIPNQA